MYKFYEQMRKKTHVVSALETIPTDSTWNYIYRLHHTHETV